MAKLTLIGCGLVMVGILSDAGGRAALAQSNPEAPKVLSQERPSFAVASVKPAPELRNALNYPAPRTPRGLASGQFDATATLRLLIGWAFYNTPNTVAEGSFRQLDDVFVITAKAAGPVPRTRPGEVGPINQMLQSLLAERFKLRVSIEQRLRSVMFDQFDMENVRKFVIGKLQPHNRVPQPLKFLSQQFKWLAGFTEEEVAPK